MLLAVNIPEVATPLALVVALKLIAPPGNVPLGLLEPLSGVLKETVAPLTGAPAAFVTVATNGAANGPPIVALCGVPLVAVMLAGAAAGVLVSEKVAEESTPATVAVTVNVPTVALAVSIAELATPLAPVVAVLTPPAKVPPGPVVGAVKVTATPATGAPATSVTVTASGAAKAVFTVALCGVPPVAAMFAGASVPV